MTRVRTKIRTGLGILAAVVACVFGTTVASAEMITFDLLSGNTALSVYPAPFANVNIDLTNATTAAVTFQTYSGGGYQYLMGDGSTVGLNVNATSFTVGSVTGANSLGGSFSPFQLQNINIPGGTVDSWGPFNLTIDNKDGFKNSVTQVQFTLTNTSGTWANALDVLLSNSAGARAVSHIYVCAAGSCDPANGALTSGYASDLAPVPLPAAAWLFGSGVAALAGLARRHVVPSM